MLREVIRVWGTDPGPWERSKAKLCGKVQGQRISLQGQWKVTAVHSIGVVGSRPERKVNISSAFTKLVLQRDLEYSLC